jgi:acyl-CoA thioesterase-1
VLRGGRGGAPFDRPASYGGLAGLVQTWVQSWAQIAAFGAVLALAIMSPASAADAPLKMVALGDSLTAGFNLAGSAAFPARLEKALRAKGVAVDVANAGVSGDTASGGLARLDWSVPEGTDAVIVELGANDMLRGVDPAVTRQALDSIVRRLTERRIAVLVAGMRSIPNLGLDFAQGFEPIYADVATKYGALLYPFFLDGIAGDARFNLRDGMHPNPAGVDKVVAGILPKVEELVARARQARGGNTQ